MNTFRTISRVLVVATVMFVGAAHASDAPASSKAAISHLQQAKDVAKNNLFTAVAVAAATEVSDDNDAAKAAVETVGVLVDQAIAGEINTSALAVHYCANLGARYAGRCFAANGFEVPNPKFDNRVAKHTVAPLNEALRTAAPQIVAGLTVMGLVKAGLL